jgi:hypothetical protein
MLQHLHKAYRLGESREFNNVKKYVHPTECDTEAF